MHELSLADARRIAVGAQMLDANRPTDLMAMVEQLTLLQLDPTAAVAPAADLVAWTRLGSDFAPAHLRAALEEDRSLFELNAMIRPISDLPLHMPEMLALRENGNDWLAANEGFRRDVLAVLRESGPLQSRQIPDTAAVPWGSSGWTNNRNVIQMLEMLARRGLVAVAGRQGKQRVWDLAERVYPSDVEMLDSAEAATRRDQRRLGALGIARARGTEVPVESHFVGNAGEPAVVEGVDGEWRIDPGALGSSWEGRTALLSPFDRLVHDRDRALDLFGFEYTLEMYKPAAQRRWGYFALPILHGEQLVGKLDAKADRKAGVFVVNAVHEDVAFGKAITRAVDAEIENLASWLELEVVRA